MFTDEGIAGEGVAAVSIAGADLIANNAYTLSWVPIGKKMTITHAVADALLIADYGRFQQAMLAGKAVSA